MTAQSEVPPNNETLGRTLIDAAWNESDPEQIDALCASDLIVHDPLNSAAETGSVAYKQFVARMTEGASHVEMTIDDILGENEVVAIRTSGTFVRNDSDHDSEREMEETTVSGFEVIHIKDDRVVEWAGSVLPDRVIAEFRAGFAGDVICPGDVAYDEAPEPSGTVSLIGIPRSSSGVRGSPT